MATFNQLNTGVPTLRANSVFAGLANMIISQRVYGDNIKGTYSDLVDMARVDGSMYGDQKLYYATDVLKSEPWGKHTDAETNVLELHRPAAPEVQAIYLDQFRQIRLTVDNYLTKQAWMDQGAFTSFNSIMLGWMRDTKRVYDSTLYNTFIGTHETGTDPNGPGAKQTMDIDKNPDQNDALTMAEALATLLVDLKDVSRDYNDYGFLRSYDESDFIIVWNAKHYNTLKKIDMPVIFHKDGLLGEFTQKVLPARYFGTTGGNTNVGTGVAKGTVRSLIEQTGSAGNHYFPGDAIKVDDTVPAGTWYTEDDSIAFKCYHKGSVPFMSAFEVGTSFYNPRSLTENHYLTWGYNTLEHLSNYPFITARFGE